MGEIARRRADTWPQSNHITWTFPGTAHTAKELVVEWYDGEFLPPPEILQRIEIPKFHPRESTLFLGTRRRAVLARRRRPATLAAGKIPE